MKYQEVLDFWFGELNEPEEYNQDLAKNWFMKSDDFDNQIREKFGSWLEAAERGELDSWADDKESLMALVILLDQFSRNLYRGTPKSFANDGKAKGLTVLAIDNNWDKELHCIKRVFLYLPLEHSEKREDQELSVRMFINLTHDAPEHLKKNFAGFLEYAQRHREVIEQFGRFPHRNKILGRENTFEEEAYLSQPGAGF